MSSKISPAIFSSQASSQFNVRTSPTLQLFKNQTFVERQILCCFLKLLWEIIAVNFQFGFICVYQCC